MTISVEDGIVVCSLENRHHKFMSMAYGCFKGFYNGKLRIWLNPAFAGTERGRVQEEIWVINNILNYVERYGREDIYLDRGVREKQKAVEVDETVYERLRSLEATEEEYRRKDIEARRVQAKRDKWQQLCEEGCGNCKYRRRRGDDQYCAYSGDLLDEKHMPKYINGVHYLFNFEALPSDNCPMKVN